MFSRLTQENDMTTTTLWNHDEPLIDLGIDVPTWIEQDITGTDLAAIVQGGCSSGAYMPAVTYHEAAQTMAEHGDDVLQYIQDCYGELPKPHDDESWSSIAVFYLSCAVELWASGTEEEATTAIEAALAEARVTT